MSAALTTEENSHLNNIYLRINEVAMMSGITFELMAEEFLKLGLEFFDMKLGIVSEVEENNYFVYAVAPNPLNVDKGMEMPLGDTLCKAVFEQKVTITHLDMSKDKELVNHPVYQNIGLRSYMGAPIWLGKKLFGTLNFSSVDARSKDYGGNELGVLTTMTNFLSKQLEIDLHGQTTALIMKNLTHELRSPLNGIIGSSEIMSDTNLDQEQFELLDLIKKASNNLEESVKDLSLFIKVHRDLSASTTSSQHPVELTKELLNNIGPVLKSKNIFFKHNEMKVPKIQVSPSLFKASIRTILNECQDRRKERKEIEVSYEATNRFLQVIITDNGPKLTDNVIKLLNSFGRIEFSNQSFTTQGVNLNLSLASILMQLAGGHLRVQVIKKEDNQFVLSFPLEI